MSSCLLVAQAHAADDLSLYVRSEGKLVDAFKVEYTVFDSSSAYPGTKVLPAAASREDVTAGDGHLSTGRYGAFDPLTDAMWSPASAIAKGRIVWYYTLAEGDHETVVEREFEVVEASVSSRRAQHIARIQDLKDGGVSAALTDRALWLAAGEWTARMQRYARQKFFPSYEAKRYNWRYGLAILLDESIYALESMRRTDSELDEKLGDLQVYPGDPQNPRIEVVPPYRREYGMVQTYTVRLTGVWGLVDEATLGPPMDLREAAVPILVKILNDATRTIFAEPLGALKREKTDGHEVENATISSKVRSGFMAYLRSQELRDVLDANRGPIGVSVAGAI